MELSIQEEEMYIASQCCKETLKSLSDIVTRKIAEHNRLLSECNDKILAEQKDISNLEKTIVDCQNLIKSNQARIDSIPHEIDSLNKDISSCNLSISYLEIPAYTWEYDYWAERSYRVIDEEQTRINEDRKYDLEQQISNDEDKIAQLERELERRERNIICLNSMINEINDAINRKNELINLIKKDIDFINGSFKDFKKACLEEQNKIEELDSKILLAARYIHDLGTTLAKLNYKQDSISYNSKKPFVLSGSAIAQEAQILKIAANSSIEYISAFSRETMLLCKSSDDEVIKSVQTIVARSLLSLKTINDNYLEDQQILKKAFEYMDAYEKIKF